MVLYFNAENSFAPDSILCVPFRDEPLMPSMASDVG